MNIKYKTEQENFWAGEFGNQYVARNTGSEYIANNIALFSEILRKTESNSINSIIEFGANIGLNIKALKILKPQAEISAIEINSTAIEELKKFEDLTIYEGSILDFEVDSKRDFVLIKGVLIHINPNELNRVYDKLYSTSCKYICICEYYNPTPVEVKYRGFENKLFKRDFAGEIMDKYSDLKLIDYGFVYHRDNNFKQDDCTWFLLKKD